MDTTISLLATRQMIIDMLRGAEPEFYTMDYFINLKLGNYSDTRGWTWSAYLSEILIDKSLDEILELYHICKSHK